MSNDRFSNSTQSIEPDPSAEDLEREAEEQQGNEFMDI